MKLTFKNGLTDVLQSGLASGLWEMFLDSLDSFFFLRVFDRVFLHSLAVLETHYVSDQADLELTEIRLPA